MTLQDLIKKWEGKRIEWKELARKNYEMRDFESAARWLDDGEMASEILEDLKKLEEKE